MNIQDFKQELLDKTLNEDLIIFVNSENSFLADQYINEICAQKNLTKHYINCLAETTDSAMALVFDYTNDLNIINTEIFNEVAEDYAEFKNCVVVCKKIDPAIKGAVSDYVIQIPKLVDWQIKAYMQTICPGLSEKATDWLYTACCKNIYKIDNELQKLSCIEPEKQVEVLREIWASNTDLFERKSVFDLVEALISNNTLVVRDFLKHLDIYSAPYTSCKGPERDIDPVGLSSLLLTKLKNVLCLKYGQSTPEELGVSSGAAYYLRQCNLPVSKLKKMISFLSEIDGKLKANPSRLDFVGNRKNALLEYVITGVLACHE